jgi:RimJ/RimL family protein N-acetyltransferase
MTVAFAPDYPVVTERLRLRPFDPVSDVDPMHAYRSRPDVCRYAPIEPRTREEVAARLRRPDLTRSVLEAEGDILSLAVELRSTNQMIGDVVLFWRSAAHRQGEIGYTIHPDVQGRGFATEAAAALLDLAFEGLGLHRVTARIDERHDASLAVARKLGMRLEARSIDCQWLKNEWITLTEWAVLEHEWVPGAQPPSTEGILPEHEPRI